MDSLQRIKIMIGIVGGWAPTLGNTLIYHITIDRLYKARKQRSAAPAPDFLFSYKYLGPPLLGVKRRLVGGRGQVVHAREHALLPLELEHRRRLLLQVAAERHKRRRRRVVHGVEPARRRHARARARLHGRHVHKGVVGAHQRGDPRGHGLLANLERKRKEKKKKEEEERRRRRRRRRKKNQLVFDFIFIFFSFFRYGKRCKPSHDAGAAALCAISGDGRHAGRSQRARGQIPARCRICTRRPGAYRGWSGCAARRVHGVLPAFFFFFSVADGVIVSVLPGFAHKVRAP